MKDKTISLLSIGFGTGMLVTVVLIFAFFVVYVDWASSDERIEEFLAEIQVNNAQDTAIMEDSQKEELVKVSPETDTGYGLCDGGYNALDTKCAERMVGTS